MNRPRGPRRAAPPAPVPYPSRYRPFVRFAAKIDLVVICYKILLLILLLTDIMYPVPEFLRFLVPELSKAHVPTKRAVLAALCFQMIRAMNAFNLHRTTDPGTTLARAFSEVWWLKVGYWLSGVYFVLLAIQSKELELNLFVLAYAAMLILIEIFYRELEGEVERVRRNAGGSGGAGGAPR